METAFTTPPKNWGVTSIGLRKLQHFLARKINIHSTIRGDLIKLYLYVNMHFECVKSYWGRTAMFVLRRRKHRCPHSQMACIPHRCHGVKACYLGFPADSFQFLSWIWSLQDFTRLTSQQFEHLLQQNSKTLPIVDSAVCIYRTEIRFKLALLF